MKTKFEIGKIYRGVSGVGTIDLTITKRTPKTIWVKTCFGIDMLRVKNNCSNEETVKFKSWYCGANDIYTEDQMLKDAYYQAYEY
ncbi:hypothetical protein CMO95_01960 [Candidatus Woesearchaeota archaeon]|nr:hypothetical protein [Candidatus Woesearchaeota archaeon]|tara:strand:+ start:7504 stop:7758 length:255 start_codon:yes stop_codon:yes gene_type:complete